MRLFDAAAFEILHRAACAALDEIIRRAVQEGGVNLYPALDAWRLASNARKRLTRDL